MYSAKSSILLTNLASTLGFFQIHLKNNNNKNTTNESRAYLTNLEASKSVQHFKIIY